MSGIAGVFRRDGATIEPELLEILAKYLTILGPDADQAWAGGEFGLVQTHLAMQKDTHSNQPFSLDGKTWVVADARLDAREELVARLGLRGEVSVDSSDAEFIWHAYRAWGGKCAEHLLGDFAFIIADTRARRLVCARDHFGVKPLFYAFGAGWIIVSNLLNCVRRYELVDNRLDESFIFDFLMHGWNTNLRATAFQAIRRIAPAHVLECTPDAIQEHRYWAPTIPQEDRATSCEDHVERFSELFRRAVSDRLRNQPACVSFSGGKDSTTTAAVAWGLLKDHPVQPALHGVCAVYDRIIPDQERHFATLAARQLGMPLDLVVCDDLPVFDSDWDTHRGQTPEPSFRSIRVQPQLMEIATKKSRIILCGNGGDEALRPPAQYYHKLLREGRWLRWVGDCVRHVWALGSLPPVGLRTLLYKRAWARVRGQHPEQPTFPAWINPDAVRAHCLLERWNQFWQGSESFVDSRKPGGYRALASFLMPDALDEYHVSALPAQAEYRFPYLDLRVIKHLWSIPPIPLRFEKDILRRAFANCLPEEVLRRRKQGLAGDPLLKKAIRLPVSWESCVVRSPRLTEYVVSNPAPGGDFSRFNSYDLRAALAPFELESWIHNQWCDGA